MLKELIPLVPVHFFHIQVDCRHGKRIFRKHRLPDLSSFAGKRGFASVFVIWHEEAFRLRIEVDALFNQPSYPHFQLADSIELFFDTRDVKTTAFNTRFCHHFYFLPKPVEYEQELIQAGEATCFRGEDKHELCDPSKLEIKKIEKGKFEIFIPSQCLHGYDPLQFNRLGFTYRINLLNHSSQYFSAHDEDFPIEQQPALWASLLLKK